MARSTSPKKSLSLLRLAPSRRKNDGDDDDYEKGLRRYHEGDHQKAWDCFQRAVKTDNLILQAKCQNAMGIILTKQKANRQDQALWHYRQAKERAQQQQLQQESSQQPSLLFLLATICFNIGHVHAKRQDGDESHLLAIQYYQEALDHINMITTTNGVENVSLLDGWIYHNMGLVYSSMKQQSSLDRAIFSHEQACLRNVPKSSICLGHLYQQQLNDPKEALKCFEQALQHADALSNDDLVACHHAMGGIYTDQNDHVQSWQCHEQALSVLSSQNNPFLLARAHYRIGNAKMRVHLVSAEQSLEEILTTFHQAKTHLLQHCAKNKSAASSPSLLLLLAMVHFRIGQTQLLMSQQDEARKALNEALDTLTTVQEPRDSLVASIYLYIGETFLREEKPREALEWFQKAEHNNGNQEMAETYNQMGRAMVLLSFLEDESMWLEKALSSFSTAQQHTTTSLDASAITQINKAKTLYLLSRYEDATKAMNDCATRSPTRQQQKDRDWILEECQRLVAMIGLKHQDYQGVLGLTTGDSSWVQSVKGHACLGLGRCGEATMHYEKALALNPHDTEALLGLTRVFCLPKAHGTLLEKRDLVQKSIAATIPQRRMIPSSTMMMMIVDWEPHNYQKQCQQFETQLTCCVVSMEEGRAFSIPSHDDIFRKSCKHIKRNENLRECFDTIMMELHSYLTLAAHDCVMDQRVDTAVLTMSWACSVFALQQQQKQRVHHYKNSSAWTGGPAVMGASKDILLETVLPRVAARVVLHHEESIQELPRNDDESNRRDWILSSCLRFLCQEVMSTQRQDDPAPSSWAQSAIVAAQALFALDQVPNIEESSVDSELHLCACLYVFGRNDNMKKPTTVAALWGRLFARTILDHLLSSFQEESLRNTNGSLALTDAKAMVDTLVAKWNTATVPMFPTTVGDKKKKKRKKKRSSSPKKMSPQQSDNDDGGTSPQRQEPTRIVLPGSVSVVVSPRQNEELLLGKNTSPSRTKPRNDNATRQRREQTAPTTPESRRRRSSRSKSAPRVRRHDEAPNGPVDNIHSEPSTRMRSSMSSIKQQDTTEEATRRRSSASKSASRVQQLRRKRRNANSKTAADAS